MKPEARTARALGWVLTLFVLASCGYSLVGKGSFLPPHIKTMGVPPFKNRTGRPELSETVTQAVTEKLIRQGGVRAQPSTTGVDAILEGDIIRIHQTPVNFDEEGFATAYEITLTVGVTLKDVAEDKNIYKNPQFVFRSVYEVSGEFEDFFDASEEGIEEISEDFAEQLIATILEGF
jgi:outer membrane lipopolysaccharide assembly protein LptE/RlpB